MRELRALQKNRKRSRPKKKKGRPKKLKGGRNQTQNMSVWIRENRKGRNPEQKETNGGSRTQFSRRNSNKEREHQRDGKIMFWNKHSEKRSKFH